MKKQWKRLAALSSAAVMAAGTLLYFPTDTLQIISWGITASAEETGAGTLCGLCNGQQMHGILYRVSVPYAGFVRTFPMQQLLRNRWSVVVYQTKIGLAGL